MSMSHWIGPFRLEAEAGALLLDRLPTFLGPRAIGVMPVEEAIAPAGRRCASASR